MAREAVIGVLAKRGYEQCLERWQPLATYLSDRIPGVRFSIKPLGFDEIGKDVHNGKVDFVLANPAIYFRLEYNGDAVHLATLENLRMGRGYKVFGGVIFTRSDNKFINDIKDLAGRRVMAVDRRSFGGWIMAWREMAAHGLDPFTDFRAMRFGGTHDAVVYAVRDGLVDVGCVRTDTLERMAAEGKIRLKNFRVINARTPKSGFPFRISTRLYPEWPFARSRKIDPLLAKEVAACLLMMRDSSRAAKVAKIVGWTVPVDYHEVGAALFELGISPFVVNPGVDTMALLRVYRPWIIGVVLLFLLTGGGAFYWQLMNRRLRASMTETERVRTEMELIFDSSSEAIRYIDLNFKVRRVNRAMAAMLSCPGEDLVGRFCYDSFNSTFCHTDKCTMRRIRDSGELRVCEEIRKVGENGSSVDCLVTAVPFISADGRFLGILEYFRDIGARVAAEEKLRGSEELFRNLADSASDLLIIHHDGRVIFANKISGSMLGTEADYLVGTAILALVNHDDQSRFLVMVADLSEKKAVNPEEIRVRRADGSFFAAEVSGFVVRGVGGRHRQAAVIRDISRRRDVDLKVRQALDEARRLSFELGDRNNELLASRDRLQQLNHELTRAHDELKNAQSQMVQREKMATIGQLAAGVAHEINNPTGFINSNLSSLGRYHTNLLEYITALEQALAEGDDAPGLIAELRGGMKINHIVADLPDLVAESLDGCERIRKIVLSLKKFSRADSENDFTVADINECLESTLDIVWNELKYKARVERAFGDIPRTWCNPQQLNQVFMNLLVNAGHAIAEKGTIRIGTAAADGNIIITVADDGCGIGVEVREKMFEPFYTTKEVGCGTGLGLSIVMDIIDRHDGEIAVESEVGRGSTFTIIIPIREKPGQ